MRAKSTPPPPTFTPAMLGERDFHEKEGEANLIFTTPTTALLTWPKNDKLSVNNITIGEHLLSKLRVKAWLDDDSVNLSISILKDKYKGSSRVFFTIISTPTSFPKWERFFKMGQT
ncbi:c70eea6e-fef8-439d-a2f6-d51039fc5f5b [Sclerotinia trifoliorum]|uniref:C70eea6e-fef8-439d-a2f6-d51039fc5f5b n=1 Tax=Sclerotinia trifoliorum TaxID=28548 RepID=A0A8H2ZSE1_9HELO|nr:c70eea6e-fef8-439d-a2f6-d51039fc5f5b [Sclerotinia trifoliorum]